MGLFFERSEPTDEEITLAIRDALTQDHSSISDLEGESLKRARQLRAGATGKRLQTHRLALTVAFFGLVLVLGIVCDAKSWQSSATAMYRFAEAILAATLGLLAGEGASGG
jgi:hypothetical protein